MLAILLLLGAARTACWRLEPEPPDLLDPAIGPPTVLPDLATADRVQLSWLPGVGDARAARLVTERPHLGFPLTPGTLHLLLAVGPGTAEAVEEWYRAGAISGSGAGAAPQARPPPPQH